MYWRALFCMMIIKRLFLNLLLLLGATDGRAQSVEIDVQAGGAFPGYNDIRIPGDVGTEFSFVEDLDADPAAYWRVRGTWLMSERHSLSLLVAPLRLEAEGAFNRSIRFEGATFDPGTSVVSKFRFDSYRLTYRYGIYRSEHLDLGVGFTAKVRDAAVSVEDAEKKAEKTNTGFVPLLNFALDWRFGKRMGVEVIADALAAPQGRAEDVLVALRYRMTNRTALKGGYRILEGGVDNDEVYNFTLVHYTVVGVTVTF